MLNSSLPQLNFKFVESGIYYVGSGNTSETWDISSLNLPNNPKIVIAQPTNYNNYPKIECKNNSMIIAVSKSESSRQHFSFLFVY